MRINPKLFTVSLALATILTATSGLAAPKTKSHDNRDLSPMERIVKAIKRRLTILSDDVHIPPPSLLSDDVHIPPPTDQLPTAP